MAPRRARLWLLCTVLVAAAPLLMAPVDPGCCEACGAVCLDAGEPVDSGPAPGPRPAVDAGVPLPSRGLASGVDAGCVCVARERTQADVSLGLVAGLALLSLRRRRRGARSSLLPSTHARAPALLRRPPRRGRVR